MRKTTFKQFMAIITTIVMLLTNAMSVSADNKADGFPLPTNKVYLVTVLSKYSNGSTHEIFLYNWGPLKGQAIDKNVIMDISASEWTPIYAVANGTIRTNKYSSGSGNYLVITHDDGTYSYYGHMVQQSAYSVGSRVNAGDIIGYVGHTGSATGNHLHFEWSGHDPYCDYSSKGYVSICPNSGASAYPHEHNSSGGGNNIDSSNSYTAYVINTDGSLAINSTNAAGNKIGEIPEGAACTVYPNNTIGNWNWVTYNGISGYSYSKYLTTNPPVINPPVVNPPVASQMSVSTDNADSITESNATVHGTVSYSGDRPSEVGLYFGTTPDYLHRVAYESINFSKNPFNVWYDLNSEANQYLSAGTTYYYKFYALQDGIESCGEVKSFTTTSVSAPVPDPAPSNPQPNTWTGVVHGTDGTLVINSIPKAGNGIGLIPEGASCTVYPDKQSGNWYWVEYNGVSGYSYSAYISPSGGGTTTNTRVGVIHGTDGTLVINSIPKAGNGIGLIPEGASCTVYPDKQSGNWYWVEYNGVSGYSYKDYIALQ